MTWVPNYQLGVRVRARCLGASAIDLVHFMDDGTYYHYYDIYSLLYILYMADLKARRLTSKASPTPAALSTNGSKAWTGESSFASRPKMSIVPPS